MKPNRLLGACKECGHNVYKKNEMPISRDAYECPHCGNPSALDELLLPEIYTPLAIAREDIASMMQAGNTLVTHLGFHSQGLKAVEESAEFAQALLKYMRSRTEDNLEQVFAEYFDMLATSSQVIRALVASNDAQWLMHETVGEKLDKLEGYASLATQFKCATDASTELEQFQKLVDAK